MPSPFPGMDPFIEGHEWEDFHHGFIEEIRTVLTPQVTPRYLVRVDRHVYVEYPSTEKADRIRPDAFVLEAERGQAPAHEAGGTATVVAVAPVVLTLPLPEERRIAFLTVRDLETREVVTVIELLSPVNKRRNSEGRQEYLRKRETVLRSPANLVELDLLRGGERLPTIEPLPSADYYAFVTREPRRPKVDVYPLSLRQPLPNVPIPLKPGERDALLDLQTVVTTVYDRARYDLSIDYRGPAVPPFSDADTQWAQQLLDAAHSSTQG